jgi:Sec-independent protein secretion pathway component TatC
MARLPGAVAGARIIGERFAHSRRQQHPEGRMPLLDHLGEPRTRVVKMALALAAGMTAGFIVFNQARHVGVQNLIQVDQYLSLVTAMMLAFGLAFEVPLVIVMLNLAGVLTHERFRRWRRVLIFGVFLIARMANPSPDPVTMATLGGTCAVLVEAAEFIVRANDRRRARLHPDPYAGLADGELSPLPSGGRGRG